MKINLSRLNLVFIGVLTLLFLVLSQTTYWTHSELWSLSISRLFGEDTTHYSLYYKAAFHGLLKALYFSPTDNVGLISLARGLFALVAVGTVFLTYRLAKLVLKDKSSSLLAVLLLISASFFLSRGHRLRSDLLASPVTLSFFTLFISYMVKDLKISKNWLALALALLVLFALAITPKSILILMAHFIFLALIDRAIFWRTLGLTGVLGSVAVLFFALITGNLHVFWAPVYAFQYLQESSHMGLGVPAYWSMESFYYVFRFLYLDPILGLLALLAGVSGLISIKQFIGRASTKGLAQLLPFHTTLLCLVLLFHSDKYPFFIASFLPYFSVSATHLLSRFSRFLWWRHVVTVLSFGLFLKALLFSAVLMKENNNFVQKTAIRYLEKYTDDKVYYDGVGILPRQSAVFQYPGPGNILGLDRTISQIEQERPDLIFYTSKLVLLEPSISVYLHKNYQHLGYGVWRRKESEKDFPPLSWPLKVGTDQLFSYDRFY